jgi:hypothetical protein
MNGRLLTLGVAAAIAAATVLTGCGSKSVSQGAAAPISVNPTSPPPSTGPSGAPVTKQAITKPVTVSGQGRTLTVSAVTTGCETDDLVAHESTASVTLLVEVTSHRKTGQMCSDLAKLTRLSTTLKAPLGKRQVFDGATGKQVAANS